MSPEDLRDYVRKRVKKGYPAGELKDELLQQGYTIEAIEQAFNPERKEAKKSFSILSLLASVAVILIGVSQINDGRPASYSLGIGCLIAGVGGFIVKLVDIVRNKQ